MFGLPMETTAIMVGVIGFWCLYTAVFVITTRHWHVEDVDDTGQEEPQS